MAEGSFPERMIRVTSPCGSNVISRGEGVGKVTCWTTSGLGGLCVISDSVLGWVPEAIVLKNLLGGEKANILIDGYL